MMELEKNLERIEIVQWEIEKELEQIEIFDKAEVLNNRMADDDLLPRKIHTNTNTRMNER